MRTLAAIFALLSVLLHAGALVRHHGIVLNADLIEQVLASSPAFCHGGDETPPGIPKPSKTESGCPVCAGHAPAFALAAPEFLRTPVRLAATARWREPERVNPALRHAVCPPARGPPAAVRPVLTDLV